MKKFLPLLLLGLGCPASLWAAQSLKESTFTQVIKDVKIVSRATQAATAAKVSDRFNAPDLIRTGPDSLAELIASDKTVTRVGANTVFSFEPAGRAMNLEQGSVLFHSPKGQGGGTIRSKGASAAVLGTTLMVTATIDGGFKAIMLEGKGQITLPNGNFRILTAGQVTFVLPGSRTFGPQLNINLGKLVESSRLVQGFEQELPSKPVIQEAIERQTVLLRTGVAEDTKVLVGNQATENTVATVESSVLEQVVDNRVDRLAVAKATDVTITTTDLRDHPLHLFLDLVPFDLPVRGVLNFSGFVGKDVTINTHAINFSPFLDQADFVLGAQGTLTIQGAALALFAVPQMGQTPLLREVTLLGKAGVVVPAGMAFAASGIGEFTLESDTGLSLQNVSFVNADGKVDLDGHQALSLTGGGINAPTPSFLLEGATVSLNGGTYRATGSATVSAYGTTLTALGTTVGGDDVRFEAETSADLHAVTATAGTLVKATAKQDATFTAGSFTASGATGLAEASAGGNLVANATSFQADRVKLSATGSASLTNVTATGGATNTVSAGQNLAVSGGSLSASPTTGSLKLTAVQNLSVSGATLSANTIEVSGNSVDLNNTTANASSSLAVSAVQDVSVTGGSASVSGASGTLQVSAGRDLSVGSSAQFQADTVQMTASRNASLAGPVIRGFTMLNVSAVQNMTVASGSFTGASSAPTIRASFSAGDTLTVNSPTFANVADISLSARTVNLANINFANGSTVNLYSQFGLLAANPNTGAASVPGHVNFILNVNYNGNPAQAYVGTAINIGVRP